MNQKELKYKLLMWPLSILLFYNNCDRGTWYMGVHKTHLDGKHNDVPNETLLIERKQEDLLKEKEEEDIKENNNENSQSLKEEIFTNYNDGEQKKSSDKLNDKQQSESVLLKIKKQLYSIENQVNTNTLNIKNDEKKNSFYHKINDFVEKLKKDYNITDQSCSLHLFINQITHKIFENQNLCNCKIIMYYTGKRSWLQWRKAQISMIKFELYAKENKERPMCIFNDQELLGYQMELQGDHYLFKKHIKGKQYVTPDNFDSLSSGKLVSVKNVDEIKEVLNDKNKTVEVNGFIFFKVEIECDPPFSTIKRN